MLGRKWCVLGQTLFLYGLLAWLYVMWVNAYHVEWLPLPLTHEWWLSVRTDDFGVMSFIVSAVGFLIWRIQVYEK